MFPAAMTFPSIIPIVMKCSHATDDLIQMGVMYFYSDFSVTDTYIHCNEIIKGCEDTHNLFKDNKKYVASKSLFVKIQFSVLCIFNGNLLPRSVQVY